MDHIHIEAGGRFPSAFGNAPLGVDKPIPNALYALSDRLDQHAPSDPVKAWQWRWRHLEAEGWATARESASIDAPASAWPPGCDWTTVKWL